MLFNSYIFILFFLPVTLIVYYQLAKHTQHRVAILWLVAASLFFYAWWNPAYLGLIIASMFFNYAVGTVLSKHQPRMGVLVFGILANLMLLGYYKYSNFFIGSINTALSLEITFYEVILPLGISFFTFQQIAFLVDAYRGETREYNFLQYSLFVTFFPQLIAGPIVHHRDMLPQFGKSLVSQVNARNLAAGTTIFAIGLFKKVMLADEMAKFASPVFNAASEGASVSLFEAWGGALSYTLQLYFDFSGYVDMAIGLALMFGIRLPLNFDSPYKSTSIIEFWRRWHMTLSSFLRDYLYIPLGGNKRGSKNLNLFLTMLLGGLWHGAGWTFVLWGGMHGLYLIVNHAWRALLGGLHHSLARNVVYKVFGLLLTFLAVVIAWVFFRATDIDAALRILDGMAGVNGAYLPERYQDRWGEYSQVVEMMGVGFKDTLFEGSKVISSILLLLLVVWLAPNTHTIMRNYAPVIESSKQESRITFKPNLIWGSVVLLMLLSSFLNLGEVSEFLYFQF
jgi:alginate O-acetyltransferase complex protein AlgI